MPGDHEPLTEQLPEDGWWTGDPFPTLAELRRTNPVAWNERGFWALTTHAHISDVSKDPERFCSSQGVLLKDIDEVVPEMPGALLYVDPPDHTRYRKLIQPYFGPARMRALAGKVRACARDLVADLPTGEPVDVVDALSIPFPLVVIAELMGLPIEDWPRFRIWSDVAIQGASGVTAETETAMVEMSTYFLDAVAARRGGDGDDLITFLGTVEVEGDRLSDGELLMLLVQLLVAGNETTRNMLSGGLVALAESPAEWKRVVADPTMVESAVEELLRWTSPVISFLRTATVDTEVGGRSVSAGDHLLLLYPSANRDEAVFGASADVVDVGRAPNHHLAFGFGTHFCIGAMLARIEGRVVLDELIARFVEIEPAGPVTRIPSNTIAGVASARMVLR